MQRRQLMRQITVGAATAGALSSTSCQSQTLSSANYQVSQPLVDWRMATSWPETLDIVFNGAQQICDRVRELTSGNFSITAFPAGGIAPPLEILDTVQSNIAECGHTSSAYYIGQNPAFAFATSIPFGLNPNQQMAWLYGAGGLELIREIYADFNIIHFPAVNTGNQMGGWFKNKVQSLNDLKGIRMRMSGLAVEILKRLEVTTQTLPPGELLAALERNDLDAAEWIGPYDDEKLGLNKVAQFYYYPGWQEPGSTFDLIVNQSAWERLPKEYQRALQLSATEALLTTRSQYEAANREALQRLIGSGSELTAFSTEILAGAQKATNEFFEETASQNASFRKIYDNWKVFSQSIYKWNRVNEQSLTRFMFAES
jgi:TRAP-type mannitol/chloroaromatic compound transport system substrate-binding protein